MDTQVIDVCHFECVHPTVYKSNTTLTVCFRERTCIIMYYSMASVYKCMCVWTRVHCVAVLQEYYIKAMNMNVPC